MVCAAALANIECAISGKGVGCQAKPPGEGEAAAEAAAAAEAEAKKRKKRRRLLFMLCCLLLLLLLGGGVSAAIAGELGHVCYGHCILHGSWWCRAGWRMVYTAGVKKGSHSRDQHCMARAHACPAIDIWCRVSS